VVYVKIDKIAYGGKDRRALKRCVIFLFNFEKE